MSGESIVSMDLYKTGMLVAMFLCVRGSIFVFMDLYKTGMLVAMFLCVRGVDLCIYGPVQDRNVSGHVFVCQGDRSLYLWTCTRQEC